MENKFNAEFDRYACEGDSISAVVDGYTITAKIVRDDCQDKPDERGDGFWPSMQPESAGYIGNKPREEYEKQLKRANEVMEAWEEDEWFYCGVVLSVSYNGIELDNHATSLWGLDCNYPKNPDAASPAEDFPNNYLTEKANELLDEALEVGKKVMKAFIRSSGERKVIIEVRGGVAECTSQPDDVEVDIIDHDNLEEVA